MKIFINLTCDNFVIAGSLTRTINGQSYYMRKLPKRLSLKFLYVILC